jgi:ketosteroid isomerase-like protein
MRSICWLVFPLITCCVLGAQTLSKASVREATAAVAAVLDDWHLAATQCEEERYFGHLAPEALFVGIDEHERWSKEAFKKWAHPGFVARQIWNFKSRQRNITLAPSGEIAWFDELLDTTSMGTARGSGVLMKDGKAWLIHQYLLSLPIPRESFTEVRQLIQVQKPTPPSEEPPAARSDK